MVECLQTVKEEGRRAESYYLLVAEGLSIRRPFSFSSSVALFIPRESRAARGKLDLIRAGRDPRKFVYIYITVPVK